MRHFDTGATRDNEEGKNDYEGFLSPLVLERFGDYMTEHRRQSDGGIRASDNWQKGIPKDAYIKSNWRHFLELWKIHRGWVPYNRKTLEDALCAILFNTQGYLHETLKNELGQPKYEDIRPSTLTPLASEEVGNVEKKNHTIYWRIITWLIKFLYRRLGVKI